MLMLQTLQMQSRGIGAGFLSLFFMIAPCSEALLNGPLLQGHVLFCM